MRAFRSWCCAALLSSICLGAGAQASPVRLPLRAQGQPGSVPSSVLSYIVDARALDKPIAGFTLEWPADAAEFAGRLQVAASDDRSAWRKLVNDAPIANLHVGGEPLIERRVEFPATAAKYWRLSWAGEAPSFELTGVLAEPAAGTKGIERSKLSVNGSPVVAEPGRFEFDLGATVPVDRVNLALPERNSILLAELKSRANLSEPWQPALKRGFYRLETRNGEMSNGPVAIAPTMHRHWLVRMGEQAGRQHSTAPRLQVEWIPQATARKAPWLWVAVTLGVAVLMFLAYRLAKPRNRI